MKRVEIPQSLGYITSTTKQYWCHYCQKEFSKIKIENTEVICRSCGKTFCEEITSQERTEHPSNYQPYEIPRRRQRAPILDILSNLMSFNEDARMENIINYLMANDPNKYGNPPASAEEIKKLEAIKIIEGNLAEMNKIEKCSVCMEDWEIDQTLIKLPCSHVFHDECIKPWLKERNSCPTCRFELKTDDADYEMRKNEKRNQIRSTGGNVNSDGVENVIGSGNIVSNS